MSRPTISTLAVTAALTTSVALGTAAANAEAIVYEKHQVTAKAPQETMKEAERASIRIPTGYARLKDSWHQWSWVENVENGITIRLDLQPKVDTVRELRAERAALAKAAGVDYREFSFDVNPVGSTVRARWVFSAVDAGSEDTKPYVHVMLMSRNRLQVVGRTTEKALAKRIRNHTVNTLSFSR